MLPPAPTGKGQIDIRIIVFIYASPCPYGEGGWGEGARKLLNSVRGEMKRHKKHGIMGWLKVAAWLL